MPIYEYLCRECGHHFEWLLREGEKPTCPSCGRRKLDKMLSLPAAHTSGSSGPECPVQEAGECGAPHCCRGNCGMGEWA